MQTPRRQSHRPRKSKLDADALALRLKADHEKAIRTDDNGNNGRHYRRHGALGTTAYDPAALQRILDPSAPVPAGMANGYGGVYFVDCGERELDWSR